MKSSYPVKFCPIPRQSEFHFLETPRVMSDTWHMIGWPTFSHVSNGEEKSNSLRGGHVSPPKMMEIQSYG